VDHYKYEKYQLLFEKENLSKKDKSETIGDKLHKINYILGK